MKNIFLNIHLLPSGTYPSWRSTDVFVPFREIAPTDNNDTSVHLKIPDVVLCTLLPPARCTKLLLPESQIEYELHCRRRMPQWAYHVAADLPQSFQKILSVAP